MSITLNLSEIVAAVILVVVVWILYRLYKKFVIREGKKRLSKILLSEKETVSWRSPITGELRWKIKPAVKLTFTDGVGGLELVKFDTDPITVWHALKEKLHNSDQYSLEDLRFVRATEEKLLQLIENMKKQKSLGAKASVSPLASLRSFFQSFLE